MTIVDLGASLSVAASMVLVNVGLAGSYEKSFVAEVVWEFG